MPQKLPINAQSNLSVDPITMINIIFESWLEYNKIKEEETTKRIMIIAARDAAIEKIRSQTETIEKYLELNFSERKNVIDKMFSTLDKGIENKDDHAIDFALHGILETIKTSPLSGISELISQLEDKNINVIDI